MKKCPYCQHPLEADELVDIKVGPPGCICDPDDWWPHEVPPICNHFEPSSAKEPDICKHCQHCRECHF